MCFTLCTKNVQFLCLNKSVEVCSPKKKRGTPETRLRQIFLNNVGLHTCCTEIILHCVSVSNQLQQWTNFCTNFSPKSGGSGGRVPPVEKSGGRSPPASPPHYTPESVNNQPPFTEINWTVVGRAWSVHRSQRPPPPCISVVSSSGPGRVPRPDL